MLKNAFIAIYAVLSENMFCRDSRTFVWKKFKQKMHRWRKNDTGTGTGTCSPHHWTQRVTAAAGVGGVEEVQHWSLVSEMTRCWNRVLN